MRRTAKFFVAMVFVACGFFQAFADTVSTGEKTVAENQESESPIESTVLIEENEQQPDENHVKVKSHSYDESTSLFFYFNNMSRDDFKILLNLGSVQEKTIFEMVGFFGNFSTFVQIGLDEMDEAEKKMYEFAQRNIIRKFKTNDVALGIIINNMDLLEGRFEGWGIVSHIIDRNDILSQVYYFTAEF